MQGLRAKKLSINEERAVNYHADKRGTELNYQVLNKILKEEMMQSFIFGNLLVHQFSFV